MKQNLLKTCLVMLLAVLGWGNAWAEADYTLTPSTGSNSSYTGNCDVTVAGITWNVSGNAQLTPWRLGGKSITDVDRTVYSKTAYTNAVKKIDLTVGAASSITVNSLKLVYSTNADFSNSSEISKTFAASSTISFEGDFPANAYYKFVFNVTVSGTSNKFVEFSKVEFYNATGGSTPEPATYTVTVANNLTGGTVTANPTTAAANATVTLTATPATGYEFGAWDVKDASNNTITITNNKFTMPAANVTVSATFNAKATRPENEIFYESFDTNDGTGGNDDKWSGSIATNNIKQDNEGWVYAKGNGASKCAKFGASSSTGSATTPALGEACDATLTFKAGAWSSNSENTTLKLSVIGGGTITPATVTMTKGEWNTFTATLTSLTADSKIKFEGNSSSNSRFFLDEVSVVKTGNATPVKAVTSIAVKTAPTKVAYTEGDKFAPAGLVITATYNIGEPEDIAYAGNESKFSFEPSLSTALTAENTSVTITYGGKTATQAISVEAFSIANTQETAYTVAEAIALIDAGKGLATPVYVKGTVSEVVTAFSESYGNISVNISADGETTGAQFQLFRNFKGANKQKWTSATEAPEVGDQVVAYGTLTKYNTTYEMTEGNYVVSIIKKTPAVKYNVTVAESIENGTVTASVEKAEEGEEVTLTATPAEGYKFEAWNVVNASTSETISVTNNKFTMPAADVTVSATFAELKANVYVLADVANIEDTDEVIIVVTNANGSYALYNNNGTGSAPTAVSVTVEGNKVTTAAENIEWILSYYNGDFTLASNDNSANYLYCTNSNNGVRVGNSNPQKTFSVKDGYLYHNYTKRYVGVYNNQDFRCYTSTTTNIGGQTLAFYVKETDTPALNGTINFVAENNEGYWATFSSDRDVIFPETDVIVYTVAYDGEDLHIYDTCCTSKGAITDKTADAGSDAGWAYGYYVQANTGVLVYCDETSAKYYFVENNTDNELFEINNAPNNNQLRPASAAMTGDNLFYKLAYDDFDAKTGLGFYWGAADGAAFTCKAGTAYLAVPKSSASNLRGFSLEGEGCTTGIKAIATDKADAAIYNLQGQRVSRLQQGVNIVNGKKVIR